MSERDVQLFLEELGKQNEDFQQLHSAHILGRKDLRMLVEGRTAQASLLATAAKLSWFYLLVWKRDRSTV